MNITPEFLPEAFSGKRRRISHVTGNAYVGMPMRSFYSCTDEFSGLCQLIWQRLL